MTTSIYNISFIVISSTVLSLVNGITTTDFNEIPVENYVLEETTTPKILKDISVSYTTSKKDDIQQIERTIFSILGLIAACILICCVPWCFTNCTKQIAEQKLRTRHGRTIQEV